MPIGPTTIVGFKIWFSDGTVWTQKSGIWTLAPGTGIQFVTVYLAATYQIWNGTAFVTENYCAQFTSSRTGTISPTGVYQEFTSKSCDFYWFNPLDASFGAGTLADIPANLTSGSVTVKTGTLLSDAAFVALYNSAVNDRVAP
jgi:hypothetical protein